MINLDTCNFCLWGFRHSHNTFKYIFQAFHRALKFKFPNRQVNWFDHQDDISGIDFSNTFFITANVLYLDPTLLYQKPRFYGMPKRADCFYAIHNIDAAVGVELSEYFGKVPILNYGMFFSITKVEKHETELAQDTFLLKQPWEPYSSVIFRWGTDLLPHEIMANKPTKLFREDSQQITYIGSRGGEYDEGLDQFRQACNESGIKFSLIGGHNNSDEDVSVEENVRLIKESYMAPTICPHWQRVHGYVPCRIFKNISYGQFGVTNSAFVNQVFNNKLIYNPDAYQLFRDAKNQLPERSLEQLHTLMDEVAEKHTYLNKIDALLAGARSTMEERF